jgi:hypothetical protein
LLTTFRPNGLARRRFARGPEKRLSRFSRPAKAPQDNSGKAFATRLPALSNHFDDLNNG